MESAGIGFERSIGFEEKLPAKYSREFIFDSAAQILGMSFTGFHSCSAKTKNSILTVLLSFSKHDLSAMENLFAGYINEWLDMYLAMLQDKPNPL